MDAFCEYVYPCEAILGAIWEHHKMDISSVIKLQLVFQCVFFTGVIRVVCVVLIKVSTVVMSFFLNLQSYV